MTKEKSNEPNAAHLVGRWNLVSHEFKTSDGKVFYPWGDNPVGIVMFDGNGNFSAQIMRRNRMTFSSLIPTVDEIKSAYMGYMAYFGHVEIDPEKKMLTNHVEGALDPTWVGGKQIRFFDFDGERLILTTEPMTRGGTTITGTLVWEPAQ